VCKLVWNMNKEKNDRGIEEDRNEIFLL